MTRPLVSVVILTRDRPAEFRTLLAALAQQRLTDFEVIVVGAAASVEHHGAERDVARGLTYAQCLAQNISESRNIGLAQAQGEFVAFIDDDATPEPDWLDELVRAFGDDDVGGVGGFVRGRNGVDYQWRGALVDRYGGHLHFTLDDLSAWRNGRSDPDRFLSTVGVNGAFRRAALEAVGGFDENFHYFLDESDLCMRLQRAGWRVVLAPDAEVHHAYAASNQRQRNRAPRDLYEIAASRVYFSRRYGDPDEIDQRVELFVADQTARLTKFVQLGRLSRRQARVIAERIEDGLVEGERRFRNGPRTGGKAEPELVVPAEADFAAPPATAANPAGAGRPTRAAFVVGGFSRLSVNRAALRLAAAGCEVTVVDFQYRARRLRVWFQDGIWRHVGGVLGRDRFDAAMPTPRRHLRARKEIERIAPRRDFDVVIRPAAERYRIGDLRATPLTGLLSGFVAEPMRPGGARTAVDQLRAATKRTMAEAPADAQSLARRNSRGAGPGSPEAADRGARHLAAGSLRGGPAPSGRSGSWRQSW